MLMRLTPQFAALFTAGIVAAGILVASDRVRRLPWHWLALIAVVPVVLVDRSAGVGVDRRATSSGSISRWGLPRRCCSRRSRSAGRALSCACSRRRPLQRLGACSYSLYLTHSPIVVTVHHVVRRLGVGSGMPMFLVTLAIAVPLAVVFAMSFASLFEIPFQRHRSWAAWRDVVSARWGARAWGTETE